MVVDALPWPGFTPLSTLLLTDESHTPCLPYRGGRQALHPPVTHPAYPTGEVGRLWISDFYSVGYGWVPYWACFPYLPTLVWATRTGLFPDPKPSFLFPPTLSNPVAANPPVASGLSPISMCWVSHAIAPRDRYLESHLGEWYWNLLPTHVPWWAIAWIWPDDDEPDLFEQLWSQNDTQPESLLEAKEERKEAAPQRAPWWERRSSIGTSSPS